MNSFILLHETFPAGKQFSLKGLQTLQIPIFKQNDIILFYEDFGNIQFVSGYFQIKAKTVSSNPDGTKDVSFETDGKLTIENSVNCDLFPSSMKFNPDGESIQIFRLTSKDGKKPYHWNYKFFPWIKRKSDAKFDSGKIRLYEDYMSVSVEEPIRLQEQYFWEFMKRFRKMLKTEM